MYLAQEPDVLIGRLEGDYRRNIDIATVGLKEYMETKYEEKYALINDKNTIIEKAKKIIRNAKQEIFMNTDIDLYELQDELKEAIENNVRVIIFSFVKQEINCEGVEIFTHGRERTKDNTNTTLMIVADDDMALIADACNGRGNWKGTITNNGLMKSIIMEHIHNDIYISHRSPLRPYAWMAHRHLSALPAGLHPQRFFAAYSIPISTCLPNQPYPQPRQGEG